VSALFFLIADVFSHRVFTAQVFVGIYGSIKTKIVNWLIDTKSKEEHSLYIQHA